MLHEFADVDSEKVVEFNIALSNQRKSLEACVKSVEGSWVRCFKKDVVAGYDLVFAEAALTEEDALDRAVLEGVVVLVDEVELG